MIFHRSIHTCELLSKVPQSCLEKWVQLPLLCHPRSVSLPASAHLAPQLAIRSLSCPSSPQPSQSEVITPAINSCSASLGMQIEEGQRLEKLYSVWRFPPPPSLSFSFSPLLNSHLCSIKPGSASNGLMWELLWRLQLAKYMKTAGLDLKVLEQKLLWFRAFADTTSCVIRWRRTWVHFSACHAGQLYWAGVTIFSEIPQFVQFSIMNMDNLK